MVMRFLDQLEKAGEYSFEFQGAVGSLEGQLVVPEQLKTSHVALLGHPHSLHGGTMNNKVVTTLVRAFKELGIASLRFNFRGVGLSQGKYDAGIGESEDLLILSQLWTNELPQSRFIFAGFSFGSYVTYRAACQCPHELLISIAPPVHHYDFRSFSPQPNAWFIVQGEEDEVVSSQFVIDFAEASLPPIPVSRFAETGHFFHGKLLKLKEVLISLINERTLSV